jgi:hypothetical protein
VANRITTLAYNSGSAPTDAKPSLDCVVDIAATSLLENKVFKVPNIALICKRKIPSHKAMSGSMFDSEIVVLAKPPDHNIAAVANKRSDQRSFIVFFAKVFKMHSHACTPKRKLGLAFFVRRYTILMTFIASCKPSECDCSFFPRSHVDNRSP